MPHSLTIGTPPSNAVKRQRSQDVSATASSRATASGQGTTGAAVGERPDPPRPVTVKIPSYLDKDRPQIAAAFRELEWKQRYRLAHACQNPETSPYRVDRSHTVVGRNRYGNVQPWDPSRVKLKKPIGGSDYVNASPITLTSRARKADAAAERHPRDESGPGVESRYIATQGPKHGQLSHFWHMVMQESDGEVGVIIMLTQLYEGNKEKCAQYFPPDATNPTLHLPAHEDGADDAAAAPMDDGDPFLDPPADSADADRVETDGESAISHPTLDKPDPTPAGSDSVTLLSSQYDANIGCEVRKLRLTIDGASKDIYHYFYHSWPDFGKPEAEERTALLELTRVSKVVAGRSPRIVHCSAGVGRTGTWIALDFLLQELEAGRLLESAGPSTSTPTPMHGPSGPRPAKSTETWGKSGPVKPSTPDPVEEDDDVIWTTVNALREQRMMMVMNELQYSFLYDVMKDAFFAKYADKETGPIVLDAQEPSPKVARKHSPFGGMYEHTRVGEIKGDDDTVSDTGWESEAETEIMDKAVAKSTVIDETGAADGADPYAAVAPETIGAGQRKTEQTGVRDHEVK